MEDRLESAVVAYCEKRAAHGEESIARVRELQASGVWRPVDPTVIALLDAVFADWQARGGGCL